MGNAHKMIVYYVCKVVGRITIRFDQYHIIQFRVIYSDISVDLVMEGGSSLSRVILTGKQMAFQQPNLPRFPLWKGADSAYHRS